MAKTAADEANIPVTAEAVLRWLDRTETERQLISANTEDYLEQLRESLAVELRSQWLAAALTIDDVSIETIAAALLTAVCRNFLAKLDPSAAVAAHDQREEARYQDVIRHLVEIRSKLPPGAFDERLARLPPIARASLTLAHNAQPMGAARLLEVVSGSNSPAQALREQLQGGLPAFLKDAPASLWLALADLCAAYGARAEEARALEEAAGLGVADRGRVLARAAMAHGSVGNRDQAARCIAEAREISSADAFVELMAAAFDEDADGILRSSEHLPSFVQGVAVGVMRATALLAKDEPDDAIKCLQGALELDAYSSASMIWLARSLLTKAESSRTADEARSIRQEAMDWARRARDLRREWRTQSGEAVEMMARAAVAMGNRRLAIQTCDSESGEASPDEAQWPSVAEVYVAVLLDAGEVEHASEIAGRLESAYFRSIALGAVAADQGKLEEAAQHLGQALALARHEGERMAVVRHMAAAGIWPVPDADAIRDRDPETAAMLEASAALRLGDYPQAIAALRPVSRQSPRLAGMLAVAYEKAGQPDEAVKELQDASRAPELRAEAALVLDRSGKPEQAFNVADRAVTELHADSPRLADLRRLLFNGLATKHDWSGAEQQARMMLELAPTSSSAGWAMVVAITNQGRLQDAWTEVSRLRLEPRDAQDAMTWLRLAVRYQQPREWVQAGLALLKRFPESEELHALFLLSTAKAGERDIEPEIGAQITEAWTAFLRTFPESRILKPHSIGETDADVIELLQQILEPGAAAALERARAVEDGRAPVGLLSTVANRSYVEAWTVGGTGTLNIYIPVPAVMDMEAAAAASSLDQEVVADGSALTVLSSLIDLADTVLASFSRVRIPMSLRFDAIHAVDAFSSPAREALWWDAEQGVPRMMQSPREDMERWRGLAAWVEQACERLDATEVAELPAFPGADPKQWWWLASLQLAVSDHLPFYCDDAWLRRLAASFAVPAFGTISLLDALSAAGRIPSAQRSHALTDLRKGRAVSLPITRDEFFTLAETEDWVRGLASQQMAQSGFWISPDAPGIVESALMMVDRHNRQSLAGWLADAMLGATRLAPESGRRDTVARLLASAIANYGMPDNMNDLVAAGRAVAHRVGAEDPLPVVGPILSGLLVSRMGPRQAMLTILSITRQMTPDDSRYLTMPFFTTSS